MISKFNIKAENFLTLVKLTSMVPVLTGHHQSVVITTTPLHHRNAQNPPQAVLTSPQAQKKPPQGEINLKLNKIALRWFLEGQWFW